MCVLYHPSKGNTVADTLSRLSMGSASNVMEDKRDFVW